MVTVRSFKYNLGSELLKLWLSYLHIFTYAFWILIVVKYITRHITEVYSCGLIFLNAVNFLS